jgi:DNA-binding GntR family transcriptional regulator
VPGRDDETAPGQSKPRASRIADILRGRIVAGELRPGKHLVEQQLADDLETSRGPVREALRRLEYEGLVVSSPYKGVVVVGISDEELEVIMSLRVMLESFGFRKALRVIGERELAQLNGLVWHMERGASRNDLGEVVETDVRFHESVLEMSGQWHTLQIWRSIESRIRTYLYLFDRDRDLHSIVAEHRELFDAIVAGDEDGLLELLVDHIAVPIPAA